MLLVCTFYTPHVHNLGFLRTQAERIDPRLTYVWPRDTKRDRARFEKLKEAYVKARYSKHYRITKEELEWLGEQVEELGRVVHEVCSERLAKLKAEALAKPIGLESEWRLSGFSEPGAAIPLPTTKRTFSPFGTGAAPLSVIGQLRSNASCANCAFSHDDCFTEREERFFKTFVHD